MLSTVLNLCFLPDISMKIVELRQRAALLWGLGLAPSHFVVESKREAHARMDG
ncbi:MAG: hypothetical protein KKG76_04095 [Euryarchaeota archaeon]|nr:hypothetical protein [Euryarchaeota archaeon]